jgi:hypothetical protein
MGDFRGHYPTISEQISAIEGGAMSKSSEASRR